MGTNSSRYADSPTDREKLRRAVLDLVGGRKCQSKKALPSVVDCYFHHRMNSPGAGKMVLRDFDEKNVNEVILRYNRQNRPGISTLW